MLKLSFFKKYLTGIALSVILWLLLDRPDYSVTGLVDLIFLTGLLYFIIALTSFVNNEGVFATQSFAFKKVRKKMPPMIAKMMGGGFSEEDEKLDSLYDYLNSREKKSNTNNIERTIVAAVLIVTSIIVYYIGG